MILNTLEISESGHQAFVGERLRPMETCLDIGCGIMPQTLRRPNSLHHLAEPCVGYLQLAIPKRRQPGRSVVATWEEALGMFEPVDTIFLLDVIEHLEKEDGQRLLQRTYDLAKSQVVIFTPYGYMPQEPLEGKDHWGLDVGGNHLLAHKSGWYPEDFSEWPTEIYIVKECHFNDHNSNPLPQKYDAFWAILNH
jgi:hypothetical protein